MRSPRYTVLIANRQTGAVRRLTIVRRPAVIIALTVLTVPVLIGLGARWSRQAEIDLLAQQSQALQIENESYRSATGELATQISTLQSAIAELGEDAQLDPEAKRAIENLPALVRNRAMGRGGVATSTQACLAIVSQPTRIAQARPSSATVPAIRGMTPSPLPVDDALAGIWPQCGRSARARSDQVAST